MRPRFLLDTHVLIRWLIEPRKLSEDQRRTIQNAEQGGEQVFFSAASLMEIALLASDEKPRLRISLDDIYDRLESNPFFGLLPLTYEVTREVAAIGGSLRDPADRAIVATARVHRLTLVTSDQRIIASKLVPVVE